MTDKEYTELKRKVDTAKQTRDRAQGQLDGVMARLKREFDCDTVADALKKANKLEKEAVVAEREFNEAAEAFEQEWAEHLANTTND